MSRKCSVKIGDKFERLEVIEDLGHRLRSDGVRKDRWFKVKCSCGNTNEVVSYALNDLISCGCSKSDSVNAGKFKTRHGESTVGQQSLTYLRWCVMKRRVNHQADYKDVSIYHKWFDSYEAFKRDMGECPSKKHTLDRKENDKGYEPGNCRWATAKEQQNNRRCNIRVKLADGKEMTVAELCDSHSIQQSKRATVYRRLKRGKTPEEAVKL